MSPDAGGTHATVLSNPNFEQIIDFLNRLRANGFVWFDLHPAGRFIYGE
jgi:hypothetical protein